MIEWIRAIDHPNSYILGHSYGALFGCEIAHKIGEHLSGVLLGNPGWTDIFRTISISERVPYPELLKANPKWKNPTDAIEYAKASNPEGIDQTAVDTIRELNNSYIEVHEFDTGLGIREEAKEKYYELVYKTLEA